MSLRPSPKSPLPIDSHLEDIKNLYKTHQNLLIKASPGSGKTTRIPPFIEHYSGQKVLVLEPRRLAAKWAAHRVAQENGLVLGQEVGYAFRYERAATAQTKILFLTEGTFLRHFLKDPELSGVGTVILDEFHERHLETDVVLSLLRNLQKTRKTSLKMIIMSATLQGEELKTFLSPDIAEWEVTAPLYPLQLDYLPLSSPLLRAPLEKKVVQSVRDYWDHPGDILVFLPGMKDILRTQAALGPLSPHACILHGDLDPTDQFSALTPGKMKKIILSTNIAESSLTIPGVNVVIDSGLFREASFSPWSGLVDLKERKISQNSAIQRAGRANRTGPGTCLRLYSLLDFQSRPLQQTPEIHRADLTEILLLLTRWGDLPEWFERPLEARVQKALETLRSLGAIEEKTITALGKSMLELPLPPRLGRIWVEAQRLGLSSSQRQILAFELSQWADPKAPHRLKGRILSFWPKNRNERENENEVPLEKLILSGFPDHVAKFRGPPQNDFICASGETLRPSLELKDQLAMEKKDTLWVILEVLHNKDITRMVPIEGDWTYDLSPLPFTEKVEIEYHPQKKRLEIVDALFIGAMCFERTSRKRPLDEESGPIREEALRVLSKEAKKVFIAFKESSLYSRLLHLEKILPPPAPPLEKFDEEIFFQETLSGKMDFQEEELVEQLKFSYLQYLNPHSLPPLDLLLPPTLTLPSKKVIPIHYPHGAPPYLESYIQDFYGLISTPSIAQGKIFLTLKLIGPHKRPLQITQDLNSFWNNTYPSMVKELRRDYPRHFWPDDPKTAPGVLLKRMLKGPDKSSN